MPKGRDNKMINKRKIELMKLKKEDKGNEVLQRYSIVGILDTRFREEVREGLNEDEAIVKSANKVKKDLEKEKEFALKYDRKDIVENVDIQINEVERFLPKYMTEQEIEEFIENALNKEEGNNFGKFMGMLSKQLKGKADMKQVSKVLKDKLGI